ncbi:hypothetical protein K1421_004573 [Escherichia coli]|nr:hypothetical protein [Escherichia coli]
MSIFLSEKEMQNWIIDKLSGQDGLYNSIINIDKLNEFNPKRPEEKKIKESYQFCLKNITLLHLMTDDENISATKSEILRPDVVAYSTENESLVLIELKNFSTPTREAGTELVAYAAELKSYLSYLSDGDITNVLISPDWPPLVRHFIFNMIVWQKKNFLCLEPCYDLQGNVSLTPLDINKLVIAEEALKFSFRHLGGFHICLYDDEMYNQPTSTSRLHSKLNVIKASMAKMSSDGEKTNSHGFAILCRNLNERTLAPYTITLVNVSAFSSIERYFHSPQISNASQLPRIGQKIYDIYTHYQPSGFGASMSKIYNSGRAYLEKINCKPRIEVIDTWDVLQVHTHAPYMEMVHIETWGVFKEKLIEGLNECYEDEYYTPDFNDVDFCMVCIESLIDQNYEFIKLF